MSWLNDHLVPLQPETVMQKAQGEDALYFSLFGDQHILNMQIIGL
jgi:hypothetical protein